MSPALSIISSSAPDLGAEKTEAISREGAKEKEGREGF